MSKTLYESMLEVNEGFKDLFYQIAKELRLIKLIQRIKFLELKPWVKKRIKKENNER